MNPCESGQCLNTPEGYFCKCPAGVIGRRCHLRPCDYLPCHKNSICLDLQVFPASRNSFVCRCPAGLKGFDCKQIDSPCEAEPCRNNGECVPMALRNATKIDEIIDDRLYTQYKCKCPPYFYGKNCEVLTTPDFVMEFSKSSVHNFVEVAGPSKNLQEVSNEIRLLFRMNVDRVTHTSSGRSPCVRGYKPTIPSITERYCRTLRKHPTTC